MITKDGISKYLAFNKPTRLILIACFNNRMFTETDSVATVFLTLCRQLCIDGTGRQLLYKHTANEIITMLFDLVICNSMRSMWWLS